MIDDTGSIITVDGPIEPDDLGTTITHEHLFMDTVDAWYSPSSTPRERAIAERPVAIEDLHFIHCNSTSHVDNLRLEDFDEAVAEVERFTRAGGDTLVDVTPKGVGADPERVRDLSRETGLHVVHGTAFYTRNTHPVRLDELSADDLEAEFVSDVSDGIGETDVRAGIIGEIGLSGEVHDGEETVLRAGLRAARRTGAPICVHPPIFHDRPPSWWGLWVLDVAEEEGLSPERIILCHQDLDDPIDRPDDFSNQLAIAERGGFVEFDCWGGGYDNLARNRAFPSDNWRIRATNALVDAGYASKLLFSQDVWKKSKRTAYGGFGYAHILEHVVPRLRSRGVDAAQIDRILIRNPQRALAFAVPC